MINRTDKIIFLIVGALILVAFFSQLFRTNAQIPVGYMPNQMELDLRGQFELDSRFDINLFASEERFDLGNVFSMTFDSKGRLWALTMPTYPHYYPGEQPRDKLIILEDTNKDGRADKQIVFADSLYLPTGFELGHGGAFVAGQQDLLFLQDTDGDDIADVKKVILHGFGTEDSHHSISAFEWGPGGRLYFHVGVFLHTQVETPYGPVRVEGGCTFRYDPRSQRLEPYISYNYANPWGQVFDRWGNHFIADASGGANYYANTMSGRIDYPLKHHPTDPFTSIVRPTAGVELLVSRHFPEDVQGTFLVNNNIGLQGTKYHRIYQEGAGFGSEDLGSFLQSEDDNFRPVDIQVAPDGSLYIVDWYNPLIGHMQFSLRDSARDHSHGRIWRITTRGNTLLPYDDLTQLDIDQLLKLLDSYEDRTLYRVRSELWTREKDEVLKRALVFAKDNKERLKLEVLWLHQAFNQPNEILLQELLKAKDERVRAAAVRVVKDWTKSLNNDFELLTQATLDESPRVKSEAVVGLSHYSTFEAARSIATIEDQGDKFLKYAIDEALYQLRPYWLPYIENLDDESSERIKGMYRLLTYEQLKELNSSEEKYFYLLLNNQTPQSERSYLLSGLASINKKSRLANMLVLLENLDSESNAGKQILELMLKERTSFGGKDIGVLKENFELSSNDYVRSAASAVLLGKYTLYLKEAVKKDPDLYQSLLNALYWRRNTLTKDLYPIIYEGLNSTDNIVVQRSLTLIPFINEKDDKKLEAILPRIGKKAFLKEGFIAIQSININAINESDKSKLSSEIQKIIESASDTSPFDIISGYQVVYENYLNGKVDEENISRDAGEVVIETLEGQMKYNLDTFEVQAGANFRLTLKNPDIMPHNILITVPGAMKKVGEAATQMRQDPEKGKLQYVPDIDEVLFASPLVDPKGSYTLTFKTPEEIDDYPFLCTFPGHWILMNGIMRVVESTGNVSGTHKSIGKFMVLKNVYSYKHPSKGVFTLNDGHRGSDSWSDGNWLGYEGEHLEVTIDFGEQENINSLNFGSLADEGAYVFHPIGAKVYVSNDGRNFRLIKNEKFDDTSGRKRENTIDLNANGYRYLRLKIESRLKNPKGHAAEGEASWIFIDEIEVN